MTADQPVTDADLDAYFADHPELVDGPVRPVQPICGTLGVAAGARSVADTEKAQDGRTTAAIDAAHLGRQRDWSTETFGPGVRLGVLDHIRKELDEVAEDPTCLEEWVDVIILGFDGAWRAGHEPQVIIDAIKAKQAKNEARSWPDWRTADRDQAIEHVRPPECQCLDQEPHAAHDWASLAHHWRCLGRAALADPEPAQVQQADEASDEEA